MDTTRHAIEIQGTGGWERIASFASEDAAIKRLQRERELDNAAKAAGWKFETPTYRIAEVK